MQMRRHPQNPLLKPRDQTWESQATFNPSVVKRDGIYHLVYRAVSGPHLLNDKQISLSRIGHAQSGDGINFAQRRILIRTEKPWEIYGCEDPRITDLEGEYFIFYTAIANQPPLAEDIKVALAISTDLKIIREKHLVTPFNAKAMALFPEKINGQYVAVLTVNTDRPPAVIALAFFDKKEEIWSLDYWQKWYQNLDKHTIQVARLSSDQVEIGTVPVKTDQGWLLFYSHIQHYQSAEGRLFGVEALLLDLKEPKKILGRTMKPFLVPTEWYEVEGKVPRVTFPSGLLKNGNQLSLYYGAADTRCCLATLTLSELFGDSSFTRKGVKKFKKYAYNPILEPIKDHPWEAKGVFNPTAVWENDKVYIIYRALSENNTSVFGCALSSDGLKIEKRLAEPIYLPRQDWEMKKRPQENSGCEDPRLTKIDNRYYLCYTAFTGIGKPGVALSSISVEDFIHHRWLWSEPVLISSPEIDDKNACLLPEKIKDQYVIFHRPEGKDIFVDFVESLNFTPGQYLSNRYKLEVPPQEWYEQKVGMAAPPLKTKQGWLAFFHGVSALDNEYRIGYMLLNLDDPTKINYISDFPLLEADLEFERKGIINNVVFPCGAILKGEEILIYYGGADRVVCVASINLKPLL